MRSTHEIYSDIHNVHSRQKPLLSVLPVLLVTVTVVIVLLLTQALGIQGMHNSRKYKHLFTTLTRWNMHSSRLC